MSFQYYNYYDDDSDADTGSMSSSGDEGGIPDEIVLSDCKHGPKRRFRLEKSRSRSSSREDHRNSDSIPVTGAVGGTVERSSSGSGMEEEMGKELDHSVEAAYAEYDRQISASGPCEVIIEKAQLKTQEAAVPDSKMYDNAYFDSDEEDGGKNRQVQSNEELFYDPDMDEADEKWMNNIRRQYQQQPASANTQGPQKPVPLPTSDAVLNCPACMSLLCVDCQRHEVYTNQYRAMFVFNCKVDHSQLMRYAEKMSKTLPARKSRKRSHLEAQQQKDDNKPSTSSSDDPRDLYCPVHCSVCNTCVAMFDSDEVYHFFNVLASHS